MNRGREVLRDRDDCKRCRTTFRLERAALGIIARRNGYIHAVFCMFDFRFHMPVHPETKHDVADVRPEGGERHKRHQQPGYWGQTRLDGLDMGHEKDGWSG